MSVSRKTMRLARSIRVDIDDAVEQALAELVRAWGVAWDSVADEWRAAVAELTAGMKDGKWPSRAVILRNARVIRAMKITAAKLDELGLQSGVRIVQGLPDLIAGQELALARIVASQVPDTFTIDWSRVSDAQLEAIVKRSTQQITSTLKPLPAEVHAGMKAELIRGVATGTNPNQVAKIMMKRFGTRFEGGMWRARTIARTEMLDATRNAALQSRLQNQGVLAGWRWMASLSSRTCPACLALNGRVFDVDEPGPDDHPNGRCTAVPVTKTWTELGIDVPEPDGQFPDSRAWFARQTPAVQQQIMGPDRLQRLNSGQLSWDQIPVRKQNPGWRDSWHPAA